MRITAELASIIAAALVFLGTCVTAYMNGPGATSKQAARDCEDENAELRQQIAAMQQQHSTALDRVLRFLDDAIWRLEQDPPDIPPRVLEGAKILKTWLETKA